MTKAEPRDGILEQWFDQAVEDASAYLWGVRALKAPPPGYEPAYLLEMVLAARARTRRALSLKSASSVPEAYTSWAEQLLAVWDRAEKALADLVDQGPGSVIFLAAGELALRARTMGLALSQVERVAQDERLMERAPWVTEELAEVSHEFVLRYNRMALAAEELSRAPADRLPGAEFLAEAGNLGESFSQKFGSLHAVAGLLPVIREREYGLERWWLTTEPDEASLPVPALATESLRFLEETFRDEEKAAPAGCPHRGRTILYATDDLEPPLTRQAREHLTECVYCRNLAADIRLAARRVLAQPAEKPPAWITEAARGAAAAGGPVKVPPRRFSPAARIAAAVSAAALLALVLILAIRARPLDTASLEGPAGPDKVVSTPVPPPDEPEDNAGELQMPQGADLSLEAQKAGGGPAFPLRPGEALDSGDRFRARFGVPTDAWVYVAFIPGNGPARALFEGLVTGGAPYVLPNVGWFTLDDNPGVETLVLVASGQKIPDFAARVPAARTPGDVERLFPGALRMDFGFRHQ